MAILFTYSESILCPMTAFFPFDILVHALLSLAGRLGTAVLGGAAT
jgi:hypothetical protein